MHGARGGAPEGERNGNYRHGARTKELSSWEGSFERWAVNRGDCEKELHHLHHYMAPRRHCMGLMLILTSCPPPRVLIGNGAAVAGCPWRLVPNDMPPWGSSDQFQRERRIARSFTTLGR
jgi:hypothetical protein